MTQRIEIIITPNGETTVQTIGFTGASCRQASRSLELALGHRTCERLTAEFHQSQSANQEHRQRLG